VSAPAGPGGRPRRGGVECGLWPVPATLTTARRGGGRSTRGTPWGGLGPATSRRLEEAADGAPAPSRRQPIKWRSKELLTRIGSVFQDPEHQFLTGTVRDELALGPKAIKLGHTEITARTDELLERLHLTRLAEVNPYTLSGGEKRRLSVATMLATAPKVIILDEPTFGQDRRTWEELTRLLAEIADAGTAVVAATHDLDFATLLADARIELPDWEPTTEAEPTPGTTP
ncbi:ABC transporter ATP-binding protein, partial [Mycolicibacterium porcinum]|uniref:ABC transporter ATP-binding protein n=1 Tax=Mycolicibacterium porcinum TaxID=39693 RepID=UPI0034CDF593